ncbi:MAG: peptidoglycan-associated lipoprotein Pal [Alphaproteobacteria bacterium]
MRVLAVLACLLLATACARTESGEAGPGAAAGDRPAAGDEAAAGGEGAAGTADDYAPGSQEALEAEAGDTVYFAFDSAVLREPSRRVLRQQATWLERNEDARVTIEGHADERGTREYNLALGARRAEAVRAYLVGLGIERERIDTISYGEERPAVEGSNEEAWARNRRAVTRIEAVS